MEYIVIESYPKYRDLYIRQYTYEELIDKLRRFCADRMGEDFEGYREVDGYDVEITYTLNDLIKKAQSIYDDPATGLIAVIKGQLLSDQKVN